MAGALHRIAALLAIAGAITLVVSTGAATWNPDGPTDSLLETDEESLALQPNSDYAYLQENGQTIVDITAGNPNLQAEGLNPDSRSVITDVAILRYEGPEYADVWVSTDAETGIEVWADGQRIDTPSQNITLTPEETVGIDLVISTADSEAIESATTLTIHGTGEPIDSESSGGGGLGIAATEETTPEPIIRVLTPEPGVRTVEVDYIRAEEPLRANLSALELPADGFEIQTTTVQTPEQGNLSVTISGNTTAAIQEGTPAVADTAGLTPLASFEVEHNSGPALETSDLRITAPIEALPRGTSLEEITVLRLDGTDWIAEETTVDSTEAEQLRIDTTASDTGRFVIASTVPALRVQNATLSADNGTNPVTVTATISNDGTGAGNSTLSVTANETLLTTRDVELGAGEATNMTVTETVNQTGNITIAVNDVVAGTLRIPAEPTEETVQTPEPTTTPETTTPTETEPTTTESETLLEEPAGFPLSRLGGLAAAGGIFLALVVLVRRAPV